MGLAAGFKSLDDDHPTAAAGVAARGRNVFSLAVGLRARRLRRILCCVEQLANALDVVRSKRAGEQAVVADAVDAARQRRE